MEDNERERPEGFDGEDREIGSEGYNPLPPPPDIETKQAEPDGTRGYVTPPPSDTPPKEDSGDTPPQEDPSSAED